MSAQSNNQLASERREKNEVNQIKCQKQKLSKLQPENKPGFETRVLAVTVLLSPFSVLFLETELS